MGVAKRAETWGGIIGAESGRSVKVGGDRSVVIGTESTVGGIKRVELLTVGRSYRGTQL